VSARQTIAATALFLLLTLFSALTRDGAAAEERWPPWQSYTEAEDAARQKALQRKRTAAPNLMLLNRRIAQLKKAGKYAQAVLLAQQAVALAERKGADSIEVAVALDTLADLYEAQKRYADAEPLLKRSLAIRDKVKGQPGAAAVRVRLAAVYEAQGRTGDAQALRDADAEGKPGAGRGVVAAKPGGEPAPAAKEDGKTDGATEPGAGGQASNAERERAMQEFERSMRAAQAQRQMEQGRQAEERRLSRTPGYSPQGYAARRPAPPSAVAPPSTAPSNGAGMGAPPPAPAPAPDQQAAKPGSGEQEAPALSGGAPEPRPDGRAHRSLPRNGSGGTAPPASAPEPSGGSGPPDLAAAPPPPPAAASAPPPAAAPAPPPAAALEVEEPAAGSEVSEPGPVTVTRESPSGGALAPAQSPDWQVVPIYWGTDRAVQPNAQRLVFGSDRARKLQLGMAEVTVPKVHEVPNVERPWVVKIPYFDVTIYAEKEDPAKHFTVQQIKALTREELLAQVKARLASSHAFKDQALVFVHGYNTSFDNALYRTAQIAYDLDFDGAPFLYSWPSGGAVASYTYDRESAQASEPYLREFLEMVVKETGAKQVSIIAHSMGNQPVMDVLRDMRSAAPEGVEISQVILAAPDVDADSFSNLAKTIKGLAKNVTLYVASNDRALIVSRNFWGSYRAGDVPPKGPLILPGIDTIDVTAASTDTFAINHSGYASNNRLLEDIGELLRTGLRPPELRPLKFGKVTTDGGDYWRYVPAP